MYRYDLFSRRTVGWAMQERRDRCLVLSAMDMRSVSAGRNPGRCTTRIAAASTPARSTAGRSTTTA